MRLWGLTAIFCYYAYGSGCLSLGNHLLVGVDDVGVDYYTHKGIKYN